MKSEQPLGAHRISPENPPQWAVDAAKEYYFTAYSAQQAASYIATNGESLLSSIIAKHAPQPAAPTSPPDESNMGESGLRERIANAVSAYIDKAELDEVMNRNAVEGLKNDLIFIITKETK